MHPCFWWEKRSFHVYRGNRASKGAVSVACWQIFRCCYPLYTGTAGESDGMRVVVVVVGSLLFGWTGIHRFCWLVLDWMYIDPRLSSGPSAGVVHVVVAGVPETEIGSRSSKGGPTVCISFGVGPQRVSVSLI